MIGIVLYDSRTVSRATKRAAIDCGEVVRIRTVGTVYLAKLPRVVEFRSAVVKRIVYVVVSKGSDPDVGVVQRHAVVEDIVGRNIGHADSIVPSRAILGGRI